MERTAIAIFCAAFYPPIDLKLPENEQVDLIFENGYITDANEAWARMAGLESAEDLLGVKLKNLTPPSIPENLQTAKMIVRSRFTSENFETVELYDSGEKRYFHNNTVWVVEEERVTGVWGTAIDITDRKDLEERLRKLESDFRSFVEASGGPVGEDSQDFIRRLKYLTPREHEVMTYVIAGMINKEIAGTLGIAESTVKIHRRRVMEKLETASIADLVRLCEAAGIRPDEVARK
jgi:PAS domain S-box-containing protein